ncbi:MAG: extracellular solute-binding protein [Mycobacterium sp.]|nr:extracellular solute-binding protein [Mycobacterium sp.]
MAVQWGDVASWLQAVGSLLALGFAAAAVVAARRTYQIESERDRVNAEARDAQTAFGRRAQAALVSAWWGSDKHQAWGAFVRNASETPVYQVYLTIMGPDDRSDGHKTYHLVVPPGEVLFCEVDDGVDADGSPPPPRRVKLSFTDAAGVRWLRNQYGRLTELEPTLRITANPPGARVLAQFQEDFHAAYGVAVEFHTNNRGYSQRMFVADLEGTSHIDAIICPHDWLGDLKARNLIEPTVLSARHHDAFPDWALKALTIDDQLYGLPTTTDAVTLFRNMRLAPQAPTTFDELIATGLALRDAGRVRDVFTLRVGDRGDPFQLWPLFTSAGGWLFRRDSNGIWDPTRIGIAEPESVAAFERMRELGEAGTGMLRRSIGYEESIESFVSGRTPYLVSTSDALPHVRESGIPWRSARCLLSRMVGLPRR